MDSSISYNDDEHIESHLSKTQSLELAYEEAVRNTDLILKDEGARRLRLRLLMLENENDDLHHQLELGDDRIDMLEEEGNELREQLERSQEEAQRHEADSRVQTRELSNLRAELTSMNGVTMDTTKLLTEKLSLARELATLKPELEHLRSQSTYQQTVLAEKLGLQRQVSTLEVELEAEKRAAKRAAHKNDRVEKEADLQDQLETLQKELAREKRESAKRLKEVEKDLKASETRHTVLESKLDQMRTKLRAAKEQLKETENELSQARTVAAKGPTMKPEAPVKVSRKRGATEISTDVNIGTPDGVAVRGKRAAVKRGRSEQTMVGEKSMFSITPFLNRTMSVAPDTPKDQQQESVRLEENGVETHVAVDATDEPEIEVEMNPDVSSPTVVAKTLGKKKPVEKTNPLEREVLGESKCNVPKKKPAPKKSRPLSTLEKVTEEDIDENEEPDEQVSTKDDPPMTKVTNIKSKLQIKATAEPEVAGPTKKKRKLLGGKTLFDEDDGEATKRPAKVNLGAPRLLGKGGLAGPGGGLKRGLGVASGFGGFSPLKKDRRGPGASFLA